MGEITRKSHQKAVVGHDKPCFFKISEKSALFVNVVVRVRMRRSGCRGNELRTLTFAP